MSARQPILVTGAAGQVGGIGGLVVSILLGRQVSVRAFVRRDDDRADALRRAGAEIFVGDLTRTEDIARALDTCRRVYFGMSVSSSYLEAAVGMGAAAREKGDVEVLVNMSQMTVSQMSLRNMTDSRQQRQHWLAEQALNWSGLPVVHVRPTVFQENFFFLAWAAEQIARDPACFAQLEPQIHQAFQGFADRCAAALLAHASVLPACADASQKK